MFGLARGIPLDRNAKARIEVYLKGYNALHRRPGQHRGPITHAFERVFKALLWGFHNCRNGACFPSYEKIAEKAECCLDTVCEAIKALEAANILTWVHRLVRDGVRVLRTSNAYVFRDPLPCAEGRPKPVFLGRLAESENPSGTPSQDSLPLREAPKIIVLDPRNGLDEALIRLGRSLGALESKDC
jgi:hypothetical protein